MRKNRGSNLKVHQFWIIRTFNKNIKLKKPWFHQVNINNNHSQCNYQLFSLPVFKVLLKGEGRFLWRTFPLPADTWRNRSFVPLINIQPVPRTQLKLIIASEMNNSFDPPYTRAILQFTVAAFQSECQAFSLILYFIYKRTLLKFSAIEFEHEFWYSEC